jgi:predicted SAM-dependent methyltransferase
LDFGLPFPNDSVDYLYASHILEHFYPDVGENILRDAYRVLKKSGRIRICVPDLKHAVDLYLNGQKEDALGYFFKDSKPSRFYRHKYMYDFELLEAALKKAGFSSVEKQSYQHGRVPDIEKLDNRPEETLYVEATKE